MTPEKQVSPAIRILRGERDASARATHLEAATRKFLVTTNERKQMSTKTNFKRIALVAVAALGMGVLSSVPSNAAIIGVPTITTANGTATVQKSDTTTAASIAVKFNANSTNDSVSITVTLGSKPSGAVGSTDSILATASDTATSTGGAHLLSINDVGALAATFSGADSITVSSNTQVLNAAATGQVAGKFLYHLDTGLVRTAGTYTLDYYTTVYSGGAAVTTSAAFGQITIVVTDGTAAVAGAVSAAGTSTAIMYGGSSYVYTGTVDSSVSAVNTPSSSTPSAVIRVTQKQADGTASRESITATISIGNVGSTSAASGKNVTFVANANGVNDIGIFADGTSGVATITIKTTSVTFTNKQITWYSTSVDKIEGVVLGKVIGSSAASAILAKAYDATGNQIIDNTSVYAYSSNLDVIATGGTAAAPTGTACSYSAVYGGQICSLTGSADGTANITLRNKSTAALSTKASAALALTVNTQAVAKVSLAFDKATYAPGEAAYIRVVAVDAAGKNVGPSTGYTNLLATGGITSNIAFGNGSETTTAISPALGFTTASGNGFASDVAIALYKVYMPYNGGTVKITATGGSALPLAGQVAVSATATVTDNGAAALAAVTALATTVASLKTLITTLTNLVLKIQKKVKA
jgi:hypothetical protein